MSIKELYKRKLTVSEVIDIAEVFNSDEINIFEVFPYLYGYSDNPIALDTVCYLDAPPNIDDDQELFPKFVLENRLNVICTGEVFIDVYDYIVETTENFSKENFIRCINHYLEYDDFLDID